MKKWKKPSIYKGFGVFRHLTIFKFSLNFCLVFA